MRDLFEEMGLDKSYSRWDAERYDDIHEVDEDEENDLDPFEEWDTDEFDSDDYFD